MKPRHIAITLAVFVVVLIALAYERGLLPL